MSSGFATLTAFPRFAASSDCTGLHADSFVIARGCSRRGRLHHGRCAAAAGRHSGGGPCDSSPGSARIVIAAAAGFGYVAGVTHRPCVDCNTPLPSTPSHEEEASAPPGLAWDWKCTIIEDIDLTCPPNLLWNIDLSPQTGEPPVAEPAVLNPVLRLASFELPAGEGPALPPLMPYLND